jgi:hypothetical protein
MPPTDPIRKRPPAATGGAHSKTIGAQPIENIIRQTPAHVHASALEALWIADHEYTDEYCIAGNLRARAPEWRALREDLSFLQPRFARNGCLNVASIARVRAWLRWCCDRPIMGWRLERDGDDRYQVTLLTDGPVLVAMITESEMSPEAIEQAALVDHVHAIWLAAHTPAPGEAWLVTRNPDGRLVWRYLTEDAGRQLGWLGSA